MPKQITNITRLDPRSSNDRITHVGGDWGKTTEEDAIAELKEDPHAYHIRVKGYHVKMVVAKKDGREYLKTEKDRVRPDHLLDLPECR